MGRPARRLYIGPRMSQERFAERLAALFADTLFEGPGNRAVVMATATALGQFINDEAGPKAATAVEEAITTMRAYAREHARNPGGRRKSQS